MANYAILVHSLKSDSKYLGFTKLAELSYQHEMESKANNVNLTFSSLFLYLNKKVSICQRFWRFFCFFVEFFAIFCLFLKRFIYGTYKLSNVATATQREKNGNGKN